MWNKSTNNNIRIILVGLVALFIFIFSFNFVSAQGIENLTLVNSYNNFAPVITGANDLQISSDGNYFYYIVGVGGDTYYMYQYDLQTAFNLSTAIYTNNFTNLSTVGQSSFFLSDNGEHLYTAGTSNTGDNKIFHYELSDAFNISSAVIEETITCQYNSCRDVYLNDAGTRMVIVSGQTLTTTDSLRSYILPTPYYFSGASLESSSANAEFINNFVIEETGTTLYSFGFNRFSEYNFSSSYDVDDTAFIGEKLVGDVRAGLWVVYGFQQASFYITDGATVFEYIFVPTPVNPELPASGGLLDNFVNPLLSLFPDSENLTFRQRMGFVFFTMLITIILLLVGGFALSRNSDNSASSMIGSATLWIGVFMLVIEFIYFIGIGYIGIGVLITLVLLAIAGFVVPKFIRGRE